MKQIVNPQPKYDFALGEETLVGTHSDKAFLLGDQRVCTSYERFWPTPLYRNSSDYLAPSWQFKALAPSTDFLLD